LFYKLDYLNVVQIEVNESLVKLWREV